MDVSNGVTNGTHEAFYTPPEDANNAELRLKEHVERTFGVKFASYDAWYRWTCDNYPEFWRTVATFCGIHFSKPYEKVVEGSTMYPVPKWFPGAQLNYAENCLTNGKDGHVAFIEAGKSFQKGRIIKASVIVSAHEFKHYDYATLRRDVATLAHAFRYRFNVTPGDHIVGYVPNVYRTAVGMLATAAVGAVWSSTSVDFGPSGVLDRFSQVTPKILLVVSETTYKRKRHSVVDNVDEIVKGLPSLQHIIVLGDNVDLSAFADSSKYLTWTSVMSSGEGKDRPLEFVQVSFGHPLCTLFSSGTTGTPKAMVHTVGGTLLKHVEEHIIQANMTQNDVILFYTTTGWMMYNWLITVLYTGATIVLYDESPLEPDRHVLLRICQNTKATILGMGAKIFDEYAKMNVDFKTVYNLSHMRLILSTASPLKPATFDFLNAHVRPQVVIGSISGGTDIVGCFMGCTLNRRVHAGECQHFYLGMDCATLSAEGHPVVDQRAELVCRKPFPSMPSHFVNDANGERYRKAYFNRFPDVWTHGDFCVINSQTSGITIYGRSDTTLNRGGVRIGTAEIYNVVDRFEEISDSVVVGQIDPNDENNERVILFVKLHDGHALDEELVVRIKTTLRKRMSPRHVPNAVFTVPDIPYTSSGKKVELAVKQVLHGFPAEKVNSLRNPDALDHFIQFRNC
ncbi:acetoacetyl-CoA synthetase [Aphelenchoides avenae]|nr:acetoacetyl-CoA synthetase [Aphelenchus avenae]